ncbi:DNA repair protein complementing XP-C cells homolog isoform X1 [Anastrepha obliqua]|uniref:DNA repair protein complementing XP-C cells homolog isoform X1 n=1 Tax=Anastrepha obliqua TaxID=95512 RepID=UPI0024092A77|nr:DNA repair protein complementing XP-C cells homolog isoform X1 [Anastrepha obliqua]
MSDEEEESMSEGFSASEDEWKPTKDVRGGESSDDDDSDFEESRQAITAEGIGGIGAPSRRKGTTAKGPIKQTAIKKRKSAGQSLRSKLYNKYRPPPKTFPSPNSAGSNSPSASTSRTASKNAKVPNESGEPGNDSSSDSSVEDYLVNPADIDLQSSFFNVRHEGKAESISPPPIFDCNAGITKLSDSGSEDNESSAEEQTNEKAFDFGNLLDNVNSLERAKDTIAKRAADKKQDTKATEGNYNTTAMDVNSLLALGEKKSNAAVCSVKPKFDEGDEDDEGVTERAPQKLSKTKSTRVKRHTKTRPASTVVAGDTDDSDFEEVAEDTTSVSYSTTHDSSALLNNSEGLEIHVEMPTKQRRKKDKNQQDIEMALMRKLNRDLKERFLSLHKTSLLCCFARSYRYNRLLNDTPLMQTALKLLPSSNAYPPERGTEIKYFQSMVTWYKTAVKLDSSNLYGEKVRKSRRRVKRELMAQIKRKEASCKQDFVFIFVVLLRAMGLQCRLIVNMQPLPLRPAQSDLLKINLKRDGDKEVKTVKAKKPKVEEGATSAKESVKEGVVKVKEKGLKGEKEAHKEKKKVAEKEAKKGKERIKEKHQKGIGTLQDTKDVEKYTEKEVQSTEKHNKEKAQAVKDAYRERKKAPSAKLAEMKSLEKEVDNVIVSGIANPEVQKVPQRNFKRTQRNEENKMQTEEPVTKQDNVEQGEAIQKSNTSGKSAIKHAQPTQSKPRLSRLRNIKIATPDADDKPSLNVEATPIARRTRQASTEKSIEIKAITATKSCKPVIQIGSPVIPKIVIQSGKTVSTVEQSERENQPHAGGSTKALASRSRSQSPKMHISPTFLQSTDYKNKFLEPTAEDKTLPKGAHTKRSGSKSPMQKVQISTDFLRQNTNTNEPTANYAKVSRVLRSRQKSNEVVGGGKEKPPPVPQFDGADDNLDKVSKKRQPQLKKLKQKSHSRDDSDDDFEFSPPKRVKKAPKLQVKKPVVDRRVLSSDEEEGSGGTVKRNPTAADIWVEVWSDAEEQWVCVELFKGKLHSVEAIRKAASSSFAYVFAFQNDLSIKDVTARYCPNWTTTVRKSRVERAWLEEAFRPYYGQRTPRDIVEDQELRRIHEEKPMPTSIADYKDHPLYALERHLLKFQAIYPPNPPTLGFIRGEPVYARECVHTLHSREIWLKQARTVKLGEQPYKIVKARPKWDRLTQTVIKDQPLEIFGFWQTEDYEPPTAENGIVPRNAYGNVELFKECMLPKKTVHLRLSGLNRICKKLGIDCAQAVIGFDFHQGACHPLYDGFVVCEEFSDQVTAAWYQDQEEQEKKEQDKYEARVYGNWKKLIKGLLIRERLKKKYNF